jgi:hypothetical protein
MNYVNDTFIRTFSEQMLNLVDPISEHYSSSEDEPSLIKSCCGKRGDV